MSNGFTFSIPNTNSLYYPNLVKYIICLIISAVIIYPILGIKSTESYLGILLLSLILFVIINSMSSENLSNELPTTLYPYSPNLGLDGISMNAYVAGLSTKPYII